MANVDNTRWASSKVVVPPCFRLRVLPSLACTRGAVVVVVAVAVVVVVVLLGVGVGADEDDDDDEGEED